MENIRCKEVAYSTEAYQDIVTLRTEVLRKPLGLQFTPEQLAAEKDHIHIGLYIHNLLAACLMLVPEADGRIKMKQVAVLPSEQGRGLGAMLVAYAESWAEEKGFSIMYCHARAEAVPFYIKMHYRITGEMFEEVTIPHFPMEKKLR
ncbi:MAG: GNAT family N-acetyltransferase [Chitinophagales bacterium]